MVSSEDAEASTFERTFSLNPLLKVFSVDTSMEGGLKSFGKTWESGSHPVTGKPLMMSFTSSLSGYS